VPSKGRPKITKLDGSRLRLLDRSGRVLRLGWLAALALLSLQTASYEILRISERRQRTLPFHAASHEIQKPGEQEVRQRLAGLDIPFIAIARRTDSAADLLERKAWKSVPAFLLKEVLQCSDSRLWFLV
jgi:hypothetical protein